MYESGRIIIRRLPHNGDLVNEITELARREGITTGTVSAIGAVKRARIGYYDQDARLYRERDLEEPREICSCLGNISLKEGEVFVHAHVVLADGEGKTAGGHLCPGTIIFAAECRIEELRGCPLERGYDDETGLALWVERE
ncbi:MAG: DNA-binding protein [Candidatus Erginobacter occultus]|nr:DNA-binding protein [Candidatus Erginobacter occultus]